MFVVITEICGFLLQDFPKITSHERVNNKSCPHSLIFTFNIPNETFDDSRKLKLTYETRLEARKLERHTHAIKAPSKRRSSQFPYSDYTTNRLCDNDETIENIGPITRSRSLAAGFHGHSMQIAGTMSRIRSERSSRRRSPGTREKKRMENRKKIKRGYVTLTSELIMRIIRNFHKHK